MKTRLQLRRYGVVLLLFILILQACTKPETERDDKPVAISLPANIETITVFDEHRNLVAEHTASNEIEVLLESLMNAKPSYIGDPEYSGARYTLELASPKNKLVLELNDLTATASTDVSAKVYLTLPGEERARAWSLTSEWTQLLLDPAGEQAEPVIKLTLDEVNDSVTLAANRAIDKSSLEEALHSTIFIQPPVGDASSVYKLNWTDPRRVVIIFPHLPEGSAAEFKLEGIMTMAGEDFQVHSPSESMLIKIHQGIAWSGLQWLDPEGQIVREHAFHTAASIMPASSAPQDSEIIIYNLDVPAYRLDLVSGNVEDIMSKEIAIAAERAVNVNDYGMAYLFSYSGTKERYYIAEGWKSVYRAEGNGIERQEVYTTDRLIYGMAASPDGKHAAILADSSGSLGPYADLVIINADGGLVAEFKEAAYSGHSDGWHFIYPVRWNDNETIEVPIVGGPDEAFFRGKATFHYKKGLQKKEGIKTLSAADSAILRASIDGWSETDIYRMLPRSEEAGERFAAVSLGGGLGSWLIDREEQQARKLGSGPVIAWTPKGEIVYWHSTERKSVDYIAID
ncbi:hypothetical protein D3P09_21625 [Paenibacillus pinisoli]|uniref:Uncharacterized protein n=1 Tax=Paenibacillus pinisoli TaxID=1276110 RepID=A0A3A6PCD2_9BACL|nr:hypothetical protein [Paenibacillus pinisoli]RJX37580.1 hypothetical protein D3P09_21625 [Paenibacillus pinisoli]